MTQHRRPRANHDVACMDQPLSGITDNVGDGFTITGLERMLKNSRISSKLVSLKQRWKNKCDQISCMFIILTHFREFVQSDWFLPVFISHDRDTALFECFMRMHRPRIDPLERRVLFSYWKEQFCYYKSFVVKVCTYFWKCFRMRIKVCLFFFYVEWLRLCPHHSTQINGRARVYIKPFKPDAL